MVLSVSAMSPMTGPPIVSSNRCDPLRVSRVDQLPGLSLMARTLTGLGVAQMTDKPATMEHMMNLARCRFGLFARDQIQHAAARCQSMLL